MDKYQIAIGIAELTIEKNGNPSIKDFLERGLATSEGQALEWVIRMSTKSSESLVDGARKVLECYSAD